MFVADRLACIRAGRRVFAGVSFALAPGGALLLRGPNGSGKSSLLRMMAGFLQPAAGQLVWRGAAIEVDLAAYRRQLCYLGHADAVKGMLTVRENVGFAAALGGCAADRIDGALDRFGLRALAATPARHLSAGQRRRLALARLLIAERPLWLLDEPGVGLDVANRDRLEQAIATHRAQGGMVALATHGDTTIGDAMELHLGGGASRA
ncbi:MAG TPA: heme ABC exporter ATP-binding protein CcmA [Geminicoccaceae bacterium]|nr:heme ABC exporter ATP-binding protein CcmA [Geminicoccaceae bacterium]